MSRTRVLLSVLLLVGAACAHMRGRHYEVLVDSYPNPEYRLERAHAFCFVTGASAFPNGALAEQRRHDELARVCRLQARDKGVLVVTDVSASECVPCKLAWSVGAPGPSASTALPSGIAPAERPLLASAAHDAVLLAQAPPPAPPFIMQQPPPYNPPPLPPPRSEDWYRRGSSSARFRKELQLTAFHPNGVVALEASASMWSDNDAFTDDSAEVLCRALFADFPERINAKRYNVRLSGQQNR